MPTKRILCQVDKVKIHINVNKVMDVTVVVCSPHSTIHFEMGKTKTDKSKTCTPTPNFTAEENGYLRELIRSNVKIVDCKKSDTLTKVAKEAIWGQITSQLNSHKKN